MDSKALDGFELTRVLSEDPSTKTIALLGTLPSNSDGLLTTILLLEKLHFHPDKLNYFNGTSGFISELISTGNNDIYKWFKGNFNQNFNIIDEIENKNHVTLFDKNFDFKLQIICPATQKHIDKYSAQLKLMVEETYSTYLDVVKPAILNLPLSHKSWVYNILDGIKEQEDVLFKDLDPSTGFFVLPDSKWDRKTLSSLYLLVLINDRSILSLRDLTSNHIKLLQNIDNKVKEQVKLHFNVDANKLRLFVHYQPNHFHVHVTSTDNLDIKGGIVGQAHLLTTIINNLELFEDYYSKVKLHYVLGENHFLYKAMQTNQQL